MIVEHAAEALQRPVPFQLADDPLLRLGVREGAAELQFTRIGDALRTPDGTLMILDRSARQVRVFDAAGRFVRSLGRHGLGPGEFQEPALLARRGDQHLLVWDASTQRVSRFRNDSQFVESVELEVRGQVDLAPLPDGAVLAVVDGSPGTPPGAQGGRMRNVATLVRLDPEGEQVSLATFSGTEWQLQISAAGVAIRRPWYYPRLLTAVSEEGAWISYGTSWELHRRASAHGEIDRIVRFLQPVEPFTTARIREFQSAELDAAESSSVREALARRHSEEEYPETIPPVEELLVDTEGRIWVGRLDAPPQLLPSLMGRVSSNWVVLDRQGEVVLGALTLPARRRLLHADRDGVLVVTVDDADVPYVEWWPYVQ